MIRHFSEVYDMNTTLDAMTIIALHTPQAPALRKMFKGHFINYKKYKILSANIRIGCASTLPLSPDQVGLEAGEVDPRDVMNPMLFKACTGENLNALLNQIYNKTTERQDVDGNISSSVGEHKITNASERKAYYQLLSDPTWRKAHPQQGLFIKNLKPYVHKVATTQPFKYTGLQRASGAGLTEAPMISGSADPESAGTVNGFGAPSGKEIDANGAFNAVNPSVFVSNGVTPMPWLDTAVVRTQGSYEDLKLGNTQVNAIINNIPRVYMGCLIMPPAVSTKFYMRMVIDWAIAFKDWRPAYEIGTIENITLLDNYGGFIDGDTNNEYTTYFNFYHDTENSKVMEENGINFKDESSFTSNGLDSSEMVYAS